MQVAVGYRQRNDGFGLLPNNDLRDFESHAGAVPVGLAHHGAAEGRKVLVGHGCVNAFRHGIFLLSGDGGHSPPSSVSSESETVSSAAAMGSYVSLSESCDCMSISLATISSGAAFSSLNSGSSSNAATAS